METADEVVDKPTPQMENALAAFDPIDATLAELRKRHENVVYNLAITKDNEAARRVRKELVTLRADADRAYEGWNAPILLAQDGARKRRDFFKAEILKLETPLDADIKADEARRERERTEKAAAEATRVAAIRARIVGIAALPITLVAASPAELATNIIALAGAQITTEIFGEFAEEANATRATAVSALETLKAAAEAREEQTRKFEAERVENERVRVENERLAAEETERQRVALAELEAGRQRLAQEQHLSNTLAAEAARKAAEKVATDSAAAAKSLKNQADAFEAERAESLRLIAEERERLAQERRDLEESRKPAPQPDAEPQPSAQDAIVAENSAPERANEAPQTAQEVLTEVILPLAPTGALKVPDALILQVIAEAFRISESEALDWVESMDLSALRQAQEAGAL